MAWTVMWSGGPRSTAAVVGAVMEGKHVVAYNVCALGDKGHLDHVEKAWAQFSDYITTSYTELSDNIRLHGRNEDLIALMAYPAYIYAQDYTTKGHEGLIYGRKIDSPARDKLKAKGPVRYGLDEDEIDELLEEIGLTVDDLQ